MPNITLPDGKKLGFKDSVILDSDGYYSVNYNSIDVNMEKI